MKRWAQIATRVVGIAAVLSVCSCAMLRPGNPATTAGSNFGPCKSWVDCSAHEVITDPSDRCCPPTTACTVDDGGPYCAADEAYDPSDPTTWGMRTGHPVRIMRSARGQ